MNARTPAIVSDRLSDADALMWRIENDPVLRSPILVVGLLDGDPSDKDVVAAFERASEVIPRLHQRVVPDRGAGRLMWADDQHFEIERHIRLRKVDDGADIRAVLDLAEEDVVAAFDPARPPWTATIVHGLGDSASALLLRFHHSITDGVGGIELATALFDPVSKRRRKAASSTGPVTPDAASQGDGGAGLLGAVVRGATSAVTDPLGTLREANRVGRSVVRLLAPASEPLSPLFEGRSINRRLHVLEVPLDAVHDVARQCDSSINDVFLGAIAGGLHAYHAELGAHVPALRFTMPVNRRTDADAPGGNKFTPVRFVLPIDDPELTNRARIAGALSRSWRNEPSIGLTDVLALGLNRLPDQAVTAVFSGMLRSVDVDAVDVPGLRDPVALAGARVDRLWAFAPPTGAALSITLLSHLDVGCVALQSDVAAVSDPDRLARCVQLALDEVVAQSSTGGSR